MRTESPPSLIGSSRHIDFQRPESCHWKRIVYPAAASSIAIAAVVAKVFNFQGWNQSPFPSTMLSLLVGGASQYALLSLFPRKTANGLKSVIGDYATPIFLITTQVLGNVSFSKEVNEGIYSTLIGLGGAALVLTIHAMATRRLTEGREIQPILEEGNPSLKGSFLTNPAEYYVWSGFEAILGGAIWGLGSTIKQLEIFANFGAILMGEAVATAASEYALNKVSTLDREDRLARMYAKAAKVALTVSLILPGLLFIAAGASEKYGYSVLASSLYVLIGVTAKIKRHMERARFFRLQQKDLDELLPRFRCSCSRICFSTFHWTVAALAATYLGLGIAGFNFQTWKFDEFSITGVINLSSFGGALFGSYVISSVTKCFFDKKEKNSFMNELFFYTRYSLEAPIIALYILEKIKIGDLALVHASLMQMTLAAIAYTSLGSAIGLEAAIHGEYPHPRLPSALFFALMGQFVLRKALGEIQV